MNLSKDSEQCKKCKHYKDCDEKRMIACAVMNNESMQAEILEQIQEPIISPMLVEHQYRDVKIAEDTTITIDLKDFEKQLEQELYKGLYDCAFNKNNSRR